MNVLLTRIRSFFSPASRREINEELHFHLEQQIAANIASGMPANEARRQAVLTFGAFETAREQTFQERPSYYLGVIAQDVRYAIRGFLRAPTFAVTVIATLILGIGVTTAVLSVVDRILFRPLPYLHGDRLVSVGLVQSLEPQEFMVGGFFYSWRDRQRPFEMIAGEKAVPDECDLGDRNPVQIRCAAADANFLPMLGVSPIVGRTFRPEETRPHGVPVALLTYGLWSSRYNRDPNILKKYIKIDGISTQVIGVLPRDFELPSLHAANIVLPLVLDESVQRTLSPGSPMRVFARLRPGVNIEQARVEMEPLYQSALQIIPEQIRKDFHLRLRSLRDRQMQEARPVAWALLGTALSVLLIACANVASLLMARSSVRTREMAVRSALGATRQRLVAQAFTESLLLSLAGAAGGVTLAEILVRLFVVIAPPSIPYLSHTAIDLRIVLLTSAVAVLCGLSFSLVSAFRKPSSELLNARSLRTHHGLLIRKALVVAQISVSMLLLAGASLLARSFWNLSQQNLGMTADKIITANITLGTHDYETNTKVFGFFGQLSNRLRFGPGVTSVAVADSLPPAPSHNQSRFSSIGVSGRPPAPAQAGGSITYRWVSPNYFRTLGIRIIRGQGFVDNDLTAKAHFIVLGETLAERLFPGANPIGKQLELDRSSAGKVGDVVEKTSNTNDFYTVVGVATDVRNGSLTDDNLPEYYRLRRNNIDDWPREGAWGGTAAIAIRTTLPASAVSPWIRSQVASLDPTLPVDIATMDQRVSTLADGPRFQALLIGAFALTGLCLAIVGVYGIISLLVVQRTQEIGIRMALGASRQNILRLIIKQSLRMIVVGLSIGLLLSLAGSHALASLLFHVSSYDPITYIAVTLSLALCTLLAAYLPAMSATKVDPVVSLRYD
jgi:putative ABC transport system permease protein